MTAQAATCAALLTPSGAGAIAVVRLLGPDAPAILDRIFRPRTIPRLSTHEPNRLRYGDLIDGEEIIDDVLVCCVPMKECMAVDLCTHGGVRVVERALQLLERHGAKPVPADKLSDTLWLCRTIIHQDAIHALLEARTERAVRFVARQMLELPRLIEDAATACHSDPSNAERLLRQVIDPFRKARWLIEGVTVALVGPPNSGKSTLFNRLAGRDAAIVSSTPGTTRDWVTAGIEHHGVWLTLIDTAGQRTVDDPLEQLAMIRGREAAAKADLTVLVLDGSLPRPSNAELEAAGIVTAEAPFVLANKCDLGFVWTPRGSSRPSKSALLQVSALRGDGIPHVLEELTGSLGLTDEFDHYPCVFEEHQRGVIDQALSELSRDPAQAARLLRQKMLAMPHDPVESRGL